MALKGTVDAQGRSVIEFEPGDKVVMLGQSVVIPRDLGVGSINPANLGQLVATLNRILATQRALASILGLTVTET